jgi:hypothetical protein
MKHIKRLNSFEVSKRLSQDCQTLQSLVRELRIANISDFSKIEELALVMLCAILPESYDAIRINIEQDSESTLEIATALIVVEEVNKINKNGNKTFCWCCPRRQKSIYSRTSSKKMQVKLLQKLVRNIQETSHAPIATLKVTKACVHEAARSLREEVQRLQPKG